MPPTPLPLLLIGPMLRRVDPRSVSVFVATSSSADVQLTLYDGAVSNVANRPEVHVIGNAHTRAFGAQFHAAVVTASITDTTVLQPGHRYAYDVLITTDNGVSQSLHELGLTSGSSALGYAEGSLPDFVTSPQTLEDLVIAHASCRKPHGAGDPAMQYVDKIIEDARDSGDGRPHMMFLTGDQIYADDVAAALAPGINQLGIRLISGDGAGAGVEQVPSPAGGGPFKVNTAQLPPGFRQKPMGVAGFTSDAATCHLIGFGEWLAMYCIVWNPELWPVLAVADSSAAAPHLSDDLKKQLQDDHGATGAPTVLGQPGPEADATVIAPLYSGTDAANKALAAAFQSFVDNKSVLDDFRKEVSHVRRLLANVPTYMICDDHEVTDDFFMTGLIRDNTTRNKFGQAVLRNALSAYVVCQGWGNEPKRWETDPDHQNLLDGIAGMFGQGWHGGLAVEAASKKVVDALGLKPHAKPKFDFSYTVDGPCHRVRVLDTRTRRYYRTPYGSPGLLTDKALDDQLPEETLPGSSAPTGLAVDGSHIYWTDYGGNAIGRANLDGTQVDPAFITGASRPYDVAVDGSHVYWTNHDSSTIGRAKLDGTGANQSFITNANTPAGITVDGSRVYWTNLGSDTIGRANLDGSGANPSFIKDANAPYGVAVDGGHVYWTNNGGTTIGRAKLDGTGVQKSFISGANAPYGVAVDGSHVYWTNYGDNTVGRADLDGTGANQSLLSGASTPSGLTVDGSHVYWTNYGDNTVGRANLDGTGANQSFITGVNHPFGLAGDHVLVVVSPAPVFGPPVMNQVAGVMMANIHDVGTFARSATDRSQQQDVTGIPDGTPLGRQYYDAESWDAEPASYEKLLERLSHFPRVVVLAGDVHYGDAYAMDWSGDDRNSRIIHFTSSAARNAWIDVVRDLMQFNGMSVGLQKIGLPHKRMGWKNTLPPIFTEDISNELLWPHIRLLDTPVLLSDELFLEHHVFARKPEWVWQCRPLFDTRANDKRPEVVRMDLPDTTGGGTLIERYGKLAAKHVEALENGGIARGLQFLSNIGIISFSRSDNKLHVTQSLYSRRSNAEPHEDAAAYIVYETPLEPVEVEVPNGVREPGAGG